MKIAKYNVGDRVLYLDINFVEKIGTISAVEETGIYKWSKEVKFVYLIGSSPYFRNEDEILELVG